MRQFFTFEYMFDRSSDGSVDNISEVARRRRRRRRRRRGGKVAVRWRRAGPEKQWWLGTRKMAPEEADCPGGDEMAREGDNERRGMLRAKYELRLT